MNCLWADELGRAPKVGPSAACAPPVFNFQASGRPTGPTNKAYMIWKIREAQKGRIPLGPRKSAHREGVTFKVLPLRMEAAVVDKLDEAWRSLPQVEKEQVSNKRAEQQRSTAP